MINKHPYPYPRLRADLDDYDNSSIECNLDCEESGMNLIIFGGFTLINDALTKLIDEGYASYCNKLMCTATNSAEFIITGKTFKYKRPKKNYAENLTVIPGIVMMKDFSGFRDGDLNEDYTDAKINLHKGDFVAETERFNISLEREDPFRSTESICKIEEGKYYNYDVRHDYILINLPKDLFGYYKALYKKPFSKTFATIFVVPVLQQVIQDYWIDGNTSDCKWYYALNEIIENEIGDITEGTNAHEIAIKLIEGLMEESGIILGKYYGDAQSGEEGYYDQY